MLIGIIDKGYEQIHIKENNGKVSFIKVNDKVSCLTKEEALNVLKEIFNTNNLKYLESNNEYDIYLDLANNKRYFKNGIEDFKMFYDNNGMNAVLYSKNGLKTFQKIMTVVVGVNISIIIALTNNGVMNFLVNYVNTNASYEQKVAIEDFRDKFFKFENSIVYDETKYDYLESSQQLEDYINESTNMQEFDKTCLKNEDYFNFVLNIVDEQSKIYDLPDRFKDMSVRYYNDKTNESWENAAGYYTNGTNTLNVKETYINDAYLYKDILDHEFIHLTQTGLSYCYIKEALAEILSTEFYGTDIDAYLNIVKNVKLLIEGIGPDAVLNAVFSHDTTKFENSIREYLDEQDTQELLNLFRMQDIYTDKRKEADDKVYNLVMKLLKNKYNENNAEIDPIILATNNPMRIYFNNNKEEYYKPIIWDHSSTKLVECDSTINYIKEVEDVKYLKLTNLSLTVEQFKENIENIKKLNITGPITMKDIQEKDLAKDFNMDGWKASVVYPTFTVDENGNFLKDGEIYPIETFLDLFINAWNENNTNEETRNSLRFEIPCDKNINIEDIENTKYIYDNQFAGNIFYNENNSFYVTQNKVGKTYDKNLILQPISDKFEVEYLNKGKSK